MLVKIDLILSPIFLSDTENLSTKAFVLSERRHNTPLSPSSVIFEYSVWYPKGVKSNLKSPVWTI